jgi:hypothetical protein
MIPMNGRLRLTNLIFTDDSFDANFEILSYNTPVPPIDPPPIDIPPAPQALPEGYNTDKNVAWQMLQHTIAAHSMDAVFYQGKGKEICRLLNEDWPGLDCYAARHTDAVVWPGFGSCDVTIDSGKRGWYFNPDALSNPHRVAYGEDR